MDSTVIGLAAIVVLGAAAQLLASFTRLPSVLLLLIAGFAAGPEGAGLVLPDELFGNLLLPLVSFSVALLLFEGGLSLRLFELQEHGGVVVRLVTLGAFITWGLTAGTALLLCGIPFSLALLLGAILTVTGPTVVLPMLRQIRPTGAASSILKWEGILIDPVGAVLAVLVFEGILAGSVGAAAWGIAVGIAKTLLIGGGLGLAMGWLLTAVLKRYWIPDHLHSPVALAAALGGFVLANGFQHESGLLAVTFMGVFLANQKSVSVRHILEFKENVRVIVISALFVILAARLRLSDLGGINAVGIAALLAALVLVIRPLCVLASTAGSATTRKERVFLASMAPRGIVAAAVASVFALRLEEAQILVPVVFLVILGTVVIYGFGAGPLARKLGLATSRPQGFLVLGAHSWARELAVALRDQGLQVLMVDTNAGNVSQARMAGLTVHHGNLLAEDADDRLELRGIGRLIALTPNDEVNALSAIHYVPLFGRREVYQLATARDEPGKREEVSRHLRGRHLFGEQWTYREISRRFDEGARIKATSLTEQFDFESWREQHGEHALPLLTIDGGGFVLLATVDQPLAPEPSQTLVALVEEAPERKDPPT
ncbi:MAG: cation:proton antiporter [Planctomycetota bacterium]|jgi:NhaP-type Na+/H+ or K+/H+ antiporter